MAFDDETGLIDFTAIEPEQLNIEHPERTKWKTAWENHRLLYVGGEEMLSAAGQYTAARTDATPVTLTSISAILTRDKRWRRFLFQMDGEPDAKYLNRWQRAVYLGYFGAIVDYFRHWLYSQPPQMRPALAPGAKVAPEPPDWSSSFIGNANGGGKSLVDFMRDEFLDVLLYRYGGHLLGRPGADVGGITDDNDGARVVLTPYSAPEIIDWQHDDSGELVSIYLEKKRRVRQFPDPRVEVLIRTYVDRQQWAAWEVTKGDPDKGQGDTLRLIDSGVHGLGKVPFVWHEIPDGLWVANKLASWQIDLFNQQSMLEYGSLLSCFLQPALTGLDDTAANRIFGDGTLLKLRMSEDGKSAEKFEWVAPDPAPLDFQAKRIADLKDEGYRIVHQMSLAVDSQAIGAIARSGASKIEDRRATEVILCGFGGYERDAIKRTLDLVSLIEGDSTEWTCEGFDSFDTGGLDDEMTAMGLASTLGIKSKTFNVKLQQQFATGRILNHLDEASKQLIRDEIQEAFDEEAEAGPPMPPVPPGAPEPDGDEGAAPTKASDNDGDDGVAVPSEDPQADAEGVTGAA